MIKLKHLKIAFLTLSRGTFAVLFGIFMLPMTCTVNGAIVTDGDFELEATGSPVASSALNNWAPTNSDGSLTPETQVIARDTAFTHGFAPHGGSSIAVAFSSDGSAPANTMASISQTFTTVESQAYHIQLFVANPTTDPNSRLNLFSLVWNGDAVDLPFWNSNFTIPNPSNPFPAELAGLAGTYVVAGNLGWFQVDIDVTAAGTSSTLTIAAQNNNGSATFVDDIVITPTPEPSSVALLLAGAAFMGTRRRRQQRAA